MKMPSLFDLDLAISFTNEADWKTLFNPTISWAEPIVRLVLETIKIPFLAVEISLLFTDEGKIQDLNRTFRGQDKSTNVLSFPSFERKDYDTGRIPQAEVFIFGDVAFSLETIKKEALILEKIFEEHLTHLLVHGLLHLRGYDHETDEEGEEMENLERDILLQLGFLDPYKNNANDLGL